MSNNQPLNDESPQIKGKREEIIENNNKSARVLQQNAQIDK
jgi:hypothetical protein